MLALDTVLTMEIDASRAPVDDTARRPAPDRPSEQRTGQTQQRLEMRLPSAPERIEADRQARIAADKAYAKEIGNEIAAGHAFGKHVVERAEFPGVSTREQFAELIEGVVINGEGRVLGGGRTAYWSDSTLVIRNPGTPDGGTAFRPADGYDYFLGLH